MDLRMSPLNPFSAVTDTQLALPILPFACLHSGERGAVSHYKDTHI